MQRLSAHAAFRAAVLDLAEEPTPTNARRYLVASRLLEEAQARAREGDAASSSRRPRAAKAAQS